MLRTLTRLGYTATLQFVYGHCGLRGNEVTDGLARHATLQHHRELSRCRGNPTRECPIAAEDAVARYKAYLSAVSTEAMARAAFERATKHRITLPYARIVDGRNIKRPAHLTTRAERVIRQFRTGHHPLVMTMYAPDYADLDKQERRRAYRSCALCGKHRPNVLEHLLVECDDAASQPHRRSMWSKALVGKGPEAASRLPPGATNADKLWHVLFKFPELALEYLQDAGLIPRFVNVRPDCGEALTPSGSICDGRSVWSSQTVTSQISAPQSTPASSQPVSLSREPVDSEASEPYRNLHDDGPPLRTSRSPTPDLESVAAGGICYTDAISSDGSNDWA
ncbi:hypothetical protein DIPPA_31206 [Diplonema papillatum]|nr:hypothetical protein DIPPA_10263 [Diplonema papillatum]KAJ9444375.1 hypothetical protein DIPPA_31206 [Diplonema papillatum]